MPNFRLLFLTIALMALPSCAGTIYQADAIRPVHKAAVAAVDVIQISEFDPFKPRDTIPGGGPMSHVSYALPTPAEEINGYAHDLRAALHRLRSWDMSPQAAVENDPAIEKYLKATTEGFQATAPIPEFDTKYRPPRLLDFNSLEKIGQAARDEMMNSLHVDALAAAEYDIKLNGTSIMGVGHRHPQAFVRFRVYALGQEKPVWQDDVKGEEMEGSVGITNITLDFQKMAELSRQSAEKAYKEIQANSQKP